MKRLERIMRLVYSRYTGEQVAHVVGKIRAEIELEREKQDTRQEIAELTDKLKHLESL